MSKTSVRDQYPQLLKFQGSVLTVADTDGAPSAQGAWVKNILQIPIMRFPPLPESYTWALEILKIHWNLELDMPTQPTEVQYGFNLNISDPDPNAPVGTAQVQSLAAFTDPRVIATRREYVAPGIYLDSADAPIQNTLWNIPGTGTIDLTDGRGNGIIFVGSNLYLETALQCQPIFSSSNFNYSVSLYTGLAIEYRLKHVTLDEVVQELTNLINL